MLSLLSFTLSQPELIKKTIGHRSSKRTPARQSSGVLLWDPIGKMTKTGLSQNLAMNLLILLHDRKPSAKLFHLNQRKHEVTVHPEKILGQMCISQ